MSLPEPQSPHPELTVVVPTFQRRESVSRLLGALERQTLPPSRFEAVVVIDGSDDGTSETVEALQPRYGLRAIWQENQGRARACNVGVAAAAGGVIVLLDDDMEPAAGMLQAHLDAHLPGSRLAIVGAAPIVVYPDSPPLVRFYASGFNSRQRELAARPAELSFREAYSGNFSVRRNVFLEVGGFDPDFRVYGHEDYELCLRLQRAGVELRFSDGAMAWQHYEKSFAALARDGTSRGATAVLFAEKHPEVVETLQLARYRAAGRAWRLIRWVLLSLTTLVPRTADGVVGGMSLLERTRPAAAMRLYRYAIDYFYWVGAGAARRPGAGS
jgi:GT2 family glycosyltransferase